jgi:hypothetical protein
METALRARAAHAVHVVAEAEGADARAVVMTSDAQLLEGRYSPEETWQNLSLVVRLTVCENNNVYVFAGGVFQSKGKGELVGCNEVSGAFRSQAVDNCLRLKFPCAARENTARGCTERLHLPSAVISVLASFTLASATCLSAKATAASASDFCRLSRFTNPVATIASRSWRYV